MMEYKTGYQINSEGKYIGKVSVRENPRKKGNYPCAKNILFTEPPTLKKYQSVYWESGKWKVYSDYRGIRFFDKLTGYEMDTILTLGEEVDLNKCTEIPPLSEEAYQYFNDLTHNWEVNLLKGEMQKKSLKLEDIKRALNELDTRKLRYLFESMNGDESGKEIFDQLCKETEQLRGEYRELKKELDKESL